MRPRRAVLEPVERPVPLEDALREALDSRGLQLVTFKREPKVFDGTILLVSQDRKDYRYRTIKASVPPTTDVDTDDALYDALLLEVDQKKTRDL